MALAPPITGSTEGERIFKMHYTGASSTNVTMYTIPNGKKFVGYAYTTGTNEYIKINGESYYLGLGGGNAAMPRLDITLKAGDVITSGTATYTYYYLIGIESDV